MPDENSITLDGMDLAEQLLGFVFDCQARHNNRSDCLIMGMGLGLRAAELMATELINQAEIDYPSTIQSLRITPPAAIDYDQDAFSDAAYKLTFMDLMDLFSPENLVCIAPHLHRGWQDKKQSCRQVRSITQDRTGFGIDENLRDKLLKAQAIHNRLFFFPPPLILDIQQAKLALDTLVDFVRKLAAALGHDISLELK
jgi:hypothetical protein